MLQTAAPNNRSRPVLMATNHDVMEIQHACKGAKKAKKEQKKGTKKGKKRGQKKGTLPYIIDFLAEYLMSLIYLKPRYNHATIISKRIKTVSYSFTAT
jgi:hypothetical protein